MNCRYEPAAKSALKKVQKIWQREQYKAADKEKREAEDAEKRASNMEEARRIVLVEDSTLPPATASKIRGLRDMVEKRVIVFGWIHRLRRQGKALIFATLRDGTGFVQCVLTDLLCQSYEALILTTGSQAILLQ